jgi:hypothetical protein
VDIGDRRSAALQSSQIFREVRLSGSSDMWGGMMAASPG